ncbi:MAG: tRNA (adenosine(37)-N6)-threonylcarbamoyltransferase complex transferase subunit TsaD [Bdellovibrionota bacterium]
MAKSIILGIESSCDETALAVLELKASGEISILAEQISSQVAIHLDYGGVVPELASREHLKNLPLLYNKVLKQAGVSLSDLDGIAATRGPGLKGCLLMGYGFARALSLASGKPLIGVNHIEGHILAPFLTNPELNFPYLSLIVSGGHTEIQEVYGIGDYKLIARTTDDAAGEAFDKSAHILGFAYPGGPKLAALADTCTEDKFELPKVMRDSEGFSFSGLKTAISILIKKHESELNAEKDSGSQQLKAELAFSIQKSIVDALIFKVKQALDNSKLKTLTITGGVSANKRLRKEAAALPNVKVFLPELRHCVDNAAMIALAGAMRLKIKQYDNFSKSVVSRWPVETLGAPA